MKHCVETNEGSAHLRLLICAWLWRRSGSAACGGYGCPPAVPNWSTTPEGTQETEVNLVGNPIRSPLLCVSRRGYGAHTTTHLATCLNLTSLPLSECLMMSPGNKPSRVLAAFKKHKNALQLYTFNFKNIEQTLCFKRVLSNSKLMMKKDF